MSNRLAVMLSPRLILTSHPRKQRQSSGPGTCVKAAHFRQVQPSGGAGFTQMKQAQNYASEIETATWLDDVHDWQTTLKR